MNDLLDRVEGYLDARPALWMWQDEVVERLVNTQEYWIARNYLVVQKNREPHYGVIFEEWAKLAHLVAEIGRNNPNSRWFRRFYHHHS